MTPNAHQAALIEWVRSGSGNAICRAVAGSGKTTALVLAAREVAGDARFLAFNNAIVDHLKSRLAGTRMEAQTINSLGHRAVRRKFPNVQVQPNKYKDFLWSAFRELSEVGTFQTLSISRDERRAMRQHPLPGSEATRLASLARASLRPRELKELSDHHALDIAEELEEVVFRVVTEALEWGWRCRKEVIDYDDQVFVALMDQLPVPQFDWVFVDECQDLSVAKMRLCLRAVDPDGGRVLAVGDPRQAIYGFAGADADAFHSMKLELAATEFPLSTCYRCPTTHIELARVLCPEIHPHEGASPGTVTSVKLKDCLKEIRAGDLIICRANAPLLGLCYYLLASGVAAAIKGRDIAQPLLRALDELETRDDPFHQFLDVIDEWEAEKLSRLQRRTGDQSSRRRRVEDTAECLRTLYRAARPKVFGELRETLERLFADASASVSLSTVHKAKGLEADGVHILRPDLLLSGDIPAPSWIAVQEQNVHYVALTRSRDRLTFILEE